jgi:glycosyltransferase involved in cell wall biosynthesis
MSLGIPVISTNLPSIRELIADKENGLLIPPRDPSALAEAITSVARNPQLAAPMAKRARKTVEEKFDIEKTAPQLIELFHLHNKS